MPEGLTVRGNLDVTKSSGFMKCIGNSLIFRTLTALPENLHVDDGRWLHQPDKSPRKLTRRGKSLSTRLHQLDVTP